MLRIPTFLRDAFERPPEREGREVWFAKKEIQPRETIESGHEPDSPPEPTGSESDTTKPQRDVFRERERDVINSGVEDREAEPAESTTEDGGGTREPPEEEIHGGEEPQEETPRIRIKAETLVEKAKSALETIAKIKAILGNSTFMDKVREAAKGDDKIQDLLQSFEEDANVCDDAEKTVQNLKNEAEQFVLWQHPTERKLSPSAFAGANVRSRCIVLKPESPEEDEAERHLQRGVNHYLSDPTITDKMDSDEHWNALSIEEKAPMIERIEELAHIDETLEKMDETLTGYDTGLKIYLKQIQQLKDDIEKGGAISPPQQEWGGSSFTLKLIHFVYLAMAVKKIYEAWRKEWEYDFERAVGDCAAAISPWVAPDAVTQRLLQEQEAKIREVKEAQKKDYEKYSFGDLHKAILTPDSDPAVKMAQLEVAAEKGWLYGIEEEGSTLTVFGQPLSNFVPQSWRKNPSLIAEYYRKLAYSNTSGEKKKREEGAAAGPRQQGTPQALIDIRKIIMEEQDYWKAIGMLEWAFKDKVDIGEIGGSLFALIMECMTRDPLFAKMIRRSPKILTEAGKTAGGFPSQLLFFLKIHSVQLQNLAMTAERKGGININDPQTLKEYEQEYADTPVISAYFRTRREIIENGNVAAKEIYKDDLKKISEATIPQEVALARAIGQVMETQTVTTTTGKRISIFDNKHADYRRALERGDPSMTWDLMVKPGMDESYGRRSSFRLMKDEYLRQLFTVGTDGAVKGGNYAKNTIADIARQYKELRELATKETDPKYKQWLTNFVVEIHQHFCSPQGPMRALMHNDKFRDMEQLTFTDPGKIDPRTGKEEIYGLRDLVQAGIIKKTDLEQWKGSVAAELLQEIQNGKIIPDSLP